MPFISTEGRAAPSTLSILLYGAFGTGKSTFAATLPQPGYLLDFDDTAISYAREGMQWWREPALWDRTLPITQRWDLLRKELQSLRDGTIQGTALRSIVLDSTTSLARMAMEYALALNRQRGPDGGPIWNVHRSMVRNLVEEVLGYVLAFPGIRCVIAHSELVKHEITGEIVGQVNLPGKLTVEVPSMFDEVWLASATKTKEGMRYEINLEPTGWFQARSRLRGFFGSSIATVPNEWNAIINIMQKKGA